MRAERLEQLPTVIKTPMLICAVDPGTEVTIPSGKFKLMAGDKVTLTAATSDLIALIKKMESAPAENTQT